MGVGNVPSIDGSYRGEQAIRLRIEICVYFLKQYSYTFMILLCIVFLKAISQIRSHFKRKWKVRARLTQHNTDSL